LAPDREREPERIFGIESSSDEHIRKGSDLFDVAPTTPTDASPADLMASMAPQKIVEPKDQAPSE